MDTGWWVGKATPSPWPLGWGPAFSVELQLPVPRRSSGSPTGSLCWLRWSLQAMQKWSLEPGKGSSVRLPVLAAGLGDRPAFAKRRGSCFGPLSGQ